MTPSILTDSSVRRPSRQQRRLHARRSRKSAARLGGYLAASVVTGLVGTSPSDAAVVQVNVGPTGFNIDAINGGVADPGFTTVANFPTSGAGNLKIYNAYGGWWGFGGVSGLTLASGTTSNTPTKLSGGQTIDGSLTFTGGENNFYNSLFRTGGPSGGAAPNFGSGSYMAFKTAQNNYGWLEVIWNNTSNQFQLVSGAYESTPNTPIITPVPEPSTIAAAGVAALAMGAGAIRRARRARSVTVTSA